MSGAPSDGLFEESPLEDYDFNKFSEFFNDGEAIDLTTPDLSIARDQPTNSALPLPPSTQKTNVDCGEYLLSQPQQALAPDQLTVPPALPQMPNPMPVAPMNAFDPMAANGSGLGITLDTTTFAADVMSGQITMAQQPGYGLPVDFASDLLASAANPPKMLLQPKVGKFDEKLSNRRTRGHQNSQDFYHPRPRPVPWGPPNDRYKHLGESNIRYKHMFRYTVNGELEGDIKFTKDTLAMYTYGCKQRNVPLRIWIQHPPSQSNWRYPRSADSSKCRYVDCPVSNHTILKGMFRVAFDENPEETGYVYDPFHCAGYMHLYCLEKATNIYQKFVLGEIDLAPDQRTLHCEDTNPMALNRDGDGLVYEFRKWQEDQLQIRRADGEMLTPFNKERDILAIRLTKEHVKLQTLAREAARGDRQKAREDEGGINTDISMWEGDLDEYAKLKKREITRKKIERESKNAAKRKADEGEDDGEEEAMPAPRPKKRRRPDGTFGPVHFNPPIQVPAVPLSMRFDARSQLVSPRSVPAHGKQHQSPVAPSTPVFDGPVTRRRSKIIADSEVAALAAAAGQSSPRTPTMANKMPAIDENAMYPPKRETGNAIFDVIQIGSPDLRRPAMDQRILRPRRKREWADFEKGGENHILAKWEAEKYDYKRTARKRGRLNSVPF